MTAIWSSTCKLRKPADREEKGVRQGDDALCLSGPQVAPGTVGAGDQEENEARGRDDVPCVLASLSCSNEMTMQAKKGHCHLEENNTLTLPYNK